MKTLPKDIKRMVNRTVIIKLLLTVVWYTLIILFVIYYNDQLVVKTKDFNYLNLIVVALALFIPFMTLKIHKIFLDRSWSGVITDKKYKEIIDSTRPYKPTRDSLVRKRLTTLVVGGDNQREHKITFADDERVIDSYYKIGDEVEHYRGVKYLYNKNVNDFAKCICVCCGSILPSTDKVCSHCKHTLLH